MGDEERDYSEYEFNPDIQEHEGYSIGDDIEIVEDGESYVLGDTGQIVGFSVIPPAENPELARAFGNDPKGRTAIYVVIEGTDEPIEVRPAHMEVM